MKLYLVNSKYVYGSLPKAIEKSKDIIRDRYSKEYTCNEQWVVTQGEKGGYCVTVKDDWFKVGNENLLRVAIRVLHTEN